MEITYLPTSVAWLDHTVAGLRRFSLDRWASAITEAYLEFAGAGGRSDQRSRRHLLKSRACPCESGEITPGRWRPQRAEDDGGKAVVKQWVGGVSAGGRRR